METQDIQQIPSITNVMEKKKQSRYRKLKKAVYLKTVIENWKRIEQNDDYKQG